MVPKTKGLALTQQQVKMLLQRVDELEKERIAIAQSIEQPKSARVKAGSPESCNMGRKRFGKLA